MKEILFVIVIFSSIPFVLAQEYPELGVKVETFAENLDIPWSIVWDPDGTIFFTERNGSIRTIQDGIVSEKPILSLDVSGFEGGLLGIALDPNYSENHYIYLYYSYQNFLFTENKVVRYVESNLTLSKDKVLIDKIPGGPIHDGGRIQFGPDGKLYITTGETGNPDLAQQVTSFAGKILRINSDGSVPEDNPFSGSPIYSYGHRNPQGLDWDESGNLVATEHGPSGHDEINVIVPGANYGWPDIIGSEKMEGLVTPIMNTGVETWAPSGAEFYDGNKIPQWTGKFFVATLRGNHLHMIDFNLDKNKVLSHQKLFTGDFGRLRDVATGPDGYIYFLTSNRDGRGSPEISDDRILRIVPLNEINSFEDCVTAGNLVMESYPRQCRTTYGQSFVEEIQIPKQKIPEWVRNIFVWYTQDQVSEDELLNAIKFLVQQDIIKLD